MRIKLKTYTLIYYEPECRGMRIGMSYMKINEFYVGFYIGYSGGAVYSDNFFKVDSKLTEKSLFQINDIEEFEDNIQDRLQDCMDFIWDMCIDDGSFIPYIKPEILKTFQQHINDDGEPVLMYETEGFNFELLRFLSRHWSLLTFYK